MQTLFLAIKFTEFLNVLTIILSVTGGVVALVQWNDSNKLKRAEYVNNLFKEFNSNPDVKQVLYNIDYGKKWYNSRFHNSGKLEQATDMALNYYSYICYLYESKLIKSKEFDFYRYQVERVLKNSNVQNYLYNVYHNAKYYKDEMSFAYLFRYSERCEWTVSSTCAAICCACDSLMPAFLATFMISWIPGFLPSPAMVVACSPPIESE